MSQDEAVCKRFTRKFKTIHSSTFLALLSLAGAIAAQQQQYLPWEQQSKC